MTKIYDTDSIEDIARKIYNDFDVLASCSIFGFQVNKLGTALVPKGELVLKEILRLDEEENCRYVGSKKVRNYKYRVNSIGGPVAQKMFTWEKRIVDSEVRYTIWRYQ